MDVRVGGKGQRVTLQDYHQLQHNLDKGYGCNNKELVESLEWLDRMQAHFYQQLI